MKNVLFSAMIVVGLFIVIVGTTAYHRYDNNNKTLAILRIVHGSYDFKHIKDKDPGYLDGPDGLLTKLVLTDNQFGVIKEYGDFKNQGGLVFDRWRNPIYVVRTSAGYKACSRGRDGLANTDDDLIAE